MVICISDLQALSNSQNPFRKIQSKKYFVHQVMSEISRREN